MCLIALHLPSLLDVTFGKVLFAIHRMVKPERELELDSHH